MRKKHPSKAVPKKAAPATTDPIAAAVLRKFPGAKIVKMKQAQKEPRKMTKLNPKAVNDAIAALNAYLPIAANACDCGCAAGQRERLEVVRGKLLPALPALVAVIEAAIAAAPELFFNEASVVAVGEMPEHPCLTFESSGPQGGDAGHGGWTSLTMQDDFDNATANVCQLGFKADGKLDNEGINFNQIRRASMSVSGDWEGAGLSLGLIRVGLGLVSAAANNAEADTF